MTRFPSGDGNYAGCGHLRSAIVASFCEHEGCYNARKQRNPLDGPPGLMSSQRRYAGPAVAMPGPPSSGRTPGQAKIATLNALATWLRQAASAPGLPMAEQLRFTAWAEQVEEVTDPRNQVRAWFILAACAATGALAGAVAVMVLSR